jgi:hypothetical protein
VHVPASANPYWVEVHTINRQPLYGSERRIRGFADEASARRGMKKITRDTVANDASLAVYVTKTTKAPPSGSSTYGNPATPAATDETPKRGRGRPKGSRNKPTAGKPGPKAQKRMPRYGFNTSRFQICVDGTNPIAQVWRCITNEAKRRGRAARGGNNQTGDLPHLVNQYAVTILDERGLYVAIDDNGQPVIYPSIYDAERDALYFYEIAPDPKPALGEVHYRAGDYEVRFMPKGEEQVSAPYIIFNRKAREPMMERGERNRIHAHNRLDHAIDACNELAAAGPASSRIARIIVDAFKDDPDVEEQVRENRLREQQAARDAENDAWLERERERLAAKPKREFISEEEARRREPDHPHFQIGKRKMLKDTKDLIEASKAKYQRGANDQRGAPPEKKPDPRAGRRWDIAQEGGI